MAKVVVTDRAFDDADAILEDIENAAGRFTALKFRARITSLFDRLERYPASGSPRPRLGARIRIGIIAPYIVFYRHDTSTDEAIILRILHGHRTISRRDL